MAEFSLTVIGCGSALPMHGRHPSAQVIRYGSLQLLIDCGEGTQERLMLAGIRSFGIRHILISHLHGDHVFGLPGLLSSYSHLKRTEPLTVYGPAGLKGFLESIIQYTELKIHYPLHIVERTVKKLSVLFRDDQLEVLTFPLDHRIACNGYLIRETAPQIRLQKALVESLKLEPEQLQALKRGEDINVRGQRIRNEELTMGPAPALSYAYCSDTRYDERLLDWLQDVSILYHETTFGADQADLAAETGHCTAGDAGKLASKAGAGCLIMGHFSSRYKEVTSLEEEAREHFGHVVAAAEGQRYDLRHLAKGLMI